ncbi:unnamed protein product [Zymoseptoria tritici ST99CH_1A5]|uniref:SCA7 domain-containing protein n=2 Tax=Zymoseptoria tritici TaxID=1047171 RepID=A0A1X7RMB7_ZYMT9|nr:unnamed protein product [Zymoseptoria tritici ST99CH_3D7]SMY22262.1 unnamed protein product [Zymoseptoria tritici ST99CH_1A5]
MAPNGIVSRKTPAVAIKPNKTEGMAGLDNLFDDSPDTECGGVLSDVKKKLPVVNSAGNWNSSLKNAEALAAKPKGTGARLTAAINKVPSTLAKAFPNGKPMADKPEVLRCNHCKRAVAKHTMPKHIEGCLNKKQEKQRKKKEAKDARDAAARRERAGDSDEDDEDGANKTASKTGLTASKKRKAADDGEEGLPSKKKKKKDEPKAKAARPKAPVDVEKQCGVELPQGGQCARSLTCKSHSMGAKRSVPGRSAPYDKLLLDYQRKNQAKLQKAAFDANAPNPDDDMLPSGPVDSEEEKDAVMQSIARSWGGRPLYQPIRVPLRQKYEYNRIKGMMEHAFGGNRTGGSIFGNVGSSGGLFAPAHSHDTDVIHARKGSVIPGARSMMAPSRKPSIASGA